MGTREEEIHEQLVSRETRDAVADLKAEATRVDAAIRHLAGELTSMRGAVARLARVAGDPTLAEDAFKVMESYARARFRGPLRGLPREGWDGYDLPDRLVPK
jgi:hypothetical protein